MTNGKTLEEWSEEINSTIEKVGKMQGVLAEMTKVLLQQKNAMNKNAQGAAELTAEEKAKLLEKGTCPDCGGLSFYPGPEGGLSQNLKCVTCGSSFNVCAPFFAERI